MSVMCRKAGTLLKKIQHEFISIQVLSYHQVLNKEEVNNDVVYYSGRVTLLACEIHTENPIFHQELPLDVHRKEQKGKTITIIFNLK